MVVNKAPHILNARIRAALALVLAAALGSGVAQAGPEARGYGSPPAPLGGDSKAGSALSVPDGWKDKVGLEQRLNEAVPAGLTFKNEAGKPVKLGDYFGKRPVLLTMLQFTCTQVCSAQMQAMSSSLNDLNFTAGKEFDIITVSIDPRETPEIASGAKEEQLKLYDRAGVAQGWHFLTGDEKNIKALAKAIGFKYFYDEKSQQYIHPDGIALVTPEGHISRYYMQLQYHPQDLRFGIIEASKERVGTILDAIALSCFHYNPMTGRYSFQIMAFLRLMGVATVLGGLSAIGLMLLKEKRRPPARLAGTNLKQA